MALGHFESVLRLTASVLPATASWSSSTAPRSPLTVSSRALIVLRKSLMACASSRSLIPVPVRVPGPRTVVRHCPSTRIPLPSHAAAAACLSTSGPPAFRHSPRLGGPPGRRWYASVRALPRMWRTVPCDASTAYAAALQRGTGAALVAAFTRRALRPGNVACGDRCVRGTAPRRASSSRRRGSPRCRAGRDPPPAGRSGRSPCPTGTDAGTDAAWWPMRGTGASAQTVFPTNTTTPRMSVSLAASTVRSGERAGFTLRPAPPAPAATAAPGGTSRTSSLRRV